MTTQRQHNAGDLPDCKEISCNWEINGGSPFCSLRCVAVVLSFRISVLCLTEQGCPDPRKNFSSQIDFSQQGIFGNIPGNHGVVKKFRAVK